MTIAPSTFGGSIVTVTCSPIPFTLHWCGGDEVTGSIQGQTTWDSVTPSYRHQPRWYLFAAYLEETKGQVERLKEVFDRLAEKPTGSHCNGMEGVIEERADALEKNEEGASFDSCLIGAALRTEHYEIAGYQASVAVAKALGMTEIASLLTENLAEEVAAAEKITAAAQPILAESASEPEMPKKPVSARRNILPRRAVRTKRSQYRISRSAHPRNIVSKKLHPGGAC